MSELSPESYRPSLPFRINHLHTIYVSKYRKVAAPNYERERLETPDHDFMDLDWARCGNGKSYTVAGENVTENRPKRAVILLHGLEGSSERPYIKSMARVFNEEGWDVVAVNFRSCSGEPNRKPYSYHSGATYDLVTVLERVATEYATIAGVGFSLGGNLLLKHLGEASGSTPLAGAVAFSVPCDLKGSSFQLSRFSNRLYMWNFLRSLRKKVEAKAALFPDEVTLEGFEDIRTFREFDDRYTAPLNGFDDAEHYWEKCSSKPFISEIRTPTLMVSAADDPFLSDSCYPVEEAAANPHVRLEIPRFGGHVAFQKRGRYWSEERAVHFLNRLI